MIEQFVKSKALAVANGNDPVAAKLAAKTTAS
jgi:hypothetical protein